MATITAILTIYKRVYNLEKQIEALKKQTMKIDKFIICSNNWDEAVKYYDIIRYNLDEKEVLIVEFSKNQGVWNRFFLAYNCNTDFVFILDDDNIPGRGYIENCYNSFQEKPGIYGSWGCLFHNLQVRKDRQMITESTNIPKEITMVDMSGHSWFFPKEYLGKMFDKLLNNLEKFKFCGEELRISYRAKENGINTYVPPMNNKNITGNLQPKLGNDNKANYNEYGHTLYQEFYLETIKDGFLPIKFKK